MREQPSTAEQPIDFRELARITQELLETPTDEGLREEFTQITGGKTLTEEMLGNLQEQNTGNYIDLISPLGKMFKPKTVPEGKFVKHEVSLEDLVDRPKNLPQIEKDSINEEDLLAALKDAKSSDQPDLDQALGAVLIRAATNLKDSVDYTDIPDELTEGTLKIDQVDTGDLISEIGLGDDVETVEELVVKGEVVGSVHRDRNRNYSITEIKPDKVMPLFKKYLYG